MALCSNPNSPHEQAFPFPPQCPVCLYPVYASTEDIMVQAQVAAAAFDVPIATAGAVETPSAALVDSLQRMRDHRAAILDAAQGEIVTGADLNSTLATLWQATTDLNTTAKLMSNPTTVVAKANQFLGYGATVLNAIKSVSKIGV